MVCILGDIHGAPYWKRCVEENPDQQIVFLGDYADSHTVPASACIENTVEIFEYARSNPGQVTLLVGNHDFHYLGHTPSRYSGYNPKMKHEYKKVFDAYRDLLRVSVILHSHDEKYLCTHAGVSNTFLARNNLTVEELNTAWRERPEIFDFQDHFDSDPYGNDIYQGPLWIRPDALLRDMIPGFHQIVGHTYQKDIVQHVDSEGRKLIIICTHDERNAFRL